MRVNAQGLIEQFLGLRVFSFLHQLKASVNQGHDVVVVSRVYQELPCFREILFDGVGFDGGDPGHIARIFDDPGGDEDEHIGLFSAGIFGLKEPAEHRDIAQERNLGLTLGVVLANDAADDNGIVVFDEDGGGGGPLEGCRLIRLGTILELADLGGDFQAQDIGLIDLGGDGQLGGNVLVFIVLIADGACVRACACAVYCRLCSGEIGRVFADADFRFLVVGGQDLGGGNDIDMGVSLIRL